MCTVEAEAVGGGVFNVACGASMSLNEVIAKLRELLGTAGDISYGPDRVGDVPLSLADIDKARIQLGYEPRVLALEGLERVASWYRKTGAYRGG